MKFFLAAFLLIFTAPTLAQADMELLSITSPSGTDFIEPTTSIEAEFKFRNNGPDTILPSSSGIGAAFSANVGMRTVGVFRSPRIQPCRYLLEVIDDGPNSLLATVSLVLDRPLPPGEIVSCYAELGVYREAPALFSQDFFVGAPNNSDPNSNNNRKTLTIRTRAIPPAVTSVPISIFSYILLGSLLLACGAFANWRQK